MRSHHLLFVLLFASLALPRVISAQVPSYASPSAANHPLLRPQVPSTGTVLNRNASMPHLTATAFMQAQQTLKQKLQAQKQTLKTQLSLIKDQRKQVVVTNVNDRIASVNAEKTATMHQALTTMEAVLTTVIKQAADRQAGDDTTELDQRITLAGQTIAAADASVTAQASKTYPLTITDDTTLRQTVGATVITFRTDITDVYQQVVDARLAVMKAAEALSMLGTTNTSSTASGIMNP